MAGRNFLPDRAAFCSRCSSASSRNLRNITQVSNGSRSRSPLSPLSLRMRSRALLTRAPSLCAVVSGAELLALFRAIRPSMRSVVAGCHPLRSGRVQQRLQFRDCFPQPVRPSEYAGNLHHVAMLRQRRYFEHVGQHELSGAVLGVLLQQLVQERSGFGGVLVEEVLTVLLKPFRPLSPGAERGIVGQVTEQVEGVGVGLAGSNGQFVEADPALLQ